MARCNHDSTYDELVKTSTYRKGVREHWKVVCCNCGKKIATYTRDYEA